MIVESVVPVGLPKLAQAGGRGCEVAGGKVFSACAGDGEVEQRRVGERVYGGKEGGCVAVDDLDDGGRLENVNDDTRAATSECLVGVRSLPTGATDFLAHWLRVSGLSSGGRQAVAYGGGRWGGTPR